MAENEVYLVPPAPNKELPYLIFNLAHFPSDAAAKEYEAEIGRWFPDSIIFLGRISDGGGASVNVITERFTHIMVSRLQDFDQYKRCQEALARTLDTSSKPEGSHPMYLQDYGWGFWAADQKDPIVVEHGLEEWNRRLQKEGWEAIRYDNPERVAQWQKAVQKQFEGSNWKDHQPIVKRES